jgi:ABC-type sugar transport system substrate-binding protein
MMKRVGCFLLVLVALFLVLSCQARSSSSAAGENLGTITEAFDTGWSGPLRENMKRYRIGVVYGMFTDKLGMQMKNSMDYLAEAFNVEFVFLESGMGGSEGQLAVIESALQSGLNGILTVGCTPAMLDAAKKAGNVPIVMIQSEPTTAEVAAEMAQFDNYLGAVCENDYHVGARAAEALYAAGARNFCITGITKGFSKTHDQRAQAAIDIIRSHSDAKLLADEYNMGLMADAIASFAAAYPEMDGVFSTYGTEAAYQAFRTNGLSGKVKYATIDVSESTGEYLASEELAWIAGGQYGTTMVGFAVLYNYLADGTKILPDSAVTLYRPFLEIANLSDYETYVKYVDGRIPVYSIGEVGNMIHAFNSEVNFDYFKSLGDVYSIDDIAQRHSDIF